MVYVDNSATNQYQALSYNSESEDLGFLNLHDLGAGDYADTVTDANGCPATYLFAITEIPEAICVECRD